MANFPSETSREEKTTRRKRSSVAWQRAGNAQCGGNSGGNQWQVTGDQKLRLQRNSDGNDDAEDSVASCVVFQFHLRVHVELQSTARQIDSHTFNRSENVRLAGT